MVDLGLARVRQLLRRAPGGSGLAPLRGKVLGVLLGVRLGVELGAVRYFLFAPRSGGTGIGTRTGRGGLLSSPTGSDKNRFL